MDETRLKIVFDGDDEAVHAGRLSIATMGESLMLLLAALRRTASGIVKQAEDDESDGSVSETGRIAQEAKILDLEIVSLDKGSLDLSMAFVSKGHPQSAKRRRLAENLTLDTADRFLSDIDAESRGRERNSHARRFLRSLPAGVRTQKYSVSVGERLVREITIAQVVTTPPVPRMSVGRTVTGTVASIGIEPGREYVELREGSRGVRMRVGNRADTDRAFAMSAGLVTAFAVFPPDGQPRLVWIRPASEPRRLNPSMLSDYIFGRWAKTLKELAR